jgi:catechol 2,3-dioxygenase-like lactoylglutathione lyase family enzyme
MLGDKPAFSSFAVPDLDAARDFYERVLGITIAPGEQGAILLRLAGGHDVYVYHKPDFVPATYTVLNFQVPDIDAAVDELTARGVRFERYPDFDQDAKGIFRGEAAGQGPDIAWLTDPAGNIIAVLHG